MRTYSARKFNDVHAELTENFPLIEAALKELTTKLLNEDARENLIQD